MKKLVLILLLGCFSLVAQNQRTETWFDFPNEETLDSSRLIVVQHNLFIDPLGKAPNGRGGRQFGYKLTAIMGWGYIEPSVSTFPQLTDGYTDVVVTLGINWHMFRTTAIRYHGGFRLGREFRGGDGYEIAGMALGADLRLFAFRGGSSLYIGGELFVDHRESQENQFYGDSDAYKEGLIFKNPLSQENGIIKLGIRF